MSNYDDKAERTREYYRRQGEARAVDRIIQELQADALCQMNLTPEGLGNIVRVVEGVLEPRKLVPNE